MSHYADVEIIGEIYLDEIVAKDLAQRLKEDGYAVKKVEVFPDRMKVTCEDGMTIELDAEAFTKNGSLVFS